MSYKTTSMRTYRYIQMDITTGEERLFFMIIMGAKQPIPIT